MWIKKNINRWSAYGIFYLLLVIIQTSQLLPVTLFGIAPNLMIPVVLSIAIWEGERVGSIFGLFCGFTWDILTSKVIGYNAVFLMFTGYIVGTLTKTYLRPTVLNALILNFSALIVNGILVYVFFYLLWNHAGFTVVMRTITIPQIIYSMVYVCPLYFIVKKVSNGLVQIE